MNKQLKLILTAVLVICMATFMLTGCKDKDAYTGKSPDDVQNFNYETNKNPIVTIVVKDYGTMEAVLYPEIAPNTVNNFISLANSGYYDGLTFHRVAENFMIQGGCPEGTGSGHPGYSIKGEFTANGFENNLSHTRGVLSMARGGYSNDSAGSQFFIMHVDNSGLDGQYASFGKLIKGYEILDAIATCEVDNPYSSSPKPVEAVVIKSITVDTRGVEYPAPEKLER